MTSGGISNNRLLFKNNKLLFSLLVSGNLMKGDKVMIVVIGGSPV